MITELEKQIADFKENLRQWQESRNLHADGCNVAACKDLEDALKIIENLSIHAAGVYLNDKIKIGNLEAENQELQSKLEMANWQPIEIAPKDARFLAVVNAGMRRSVHILRHCTEGEYGFDYGMFLSPDGAHYGKDTVSHWMPLPPPPTSNNKSNESN